MNLKWFFRSLLFRYFYIFVTTGPKATDLILVVPVQLCEPCHLAVVM